jgi:hypothetical protein
MEMGDTIGIDRCPTIVVLILIVDEDGSGHNENGGLEFEVMVREKDDTLILIK